MTNVPLSVGVEFWWAEKAHREIPIGGRYSTVAKVPGENRPWPETAWSFVLDFPQGYSGVGTAAAIGHFLVETAPDHLLFSGTVIELYEGKKLAAYVQVVQDNG